MLNNYVDLLVPAIREASKAILEVYHAGFDVTIKSDNSPVTIADERSSKILCKHLSKTDTIIISEEETKAEYSVRKDASIWLVDPLDGTKEFIKKNDEFCIAIALIEEGKPVFGMIADVVGGNLIYGGADFGSYTADYELNNVVKLDDISVGNSINLINSRSHLHPKAEKIVEQLKQSGYITAVKQKGSALKFFDLALGNVQLYPRVGPTMEWDIAAGQAIFEGVGGEVLNFTNFEPLTYNKADLYNPPFIAKPKKLKLDFRL